jgi:hypothetical protein
MIRSVYRFAALAAFVLAFSLPASAQWVTLIRKVRGMSTGTTDVATVILDAGAANVYKAAMDTVQKAKLEIVKTDPAARYLQFNSQGNTITLKVDSLDKKVCQITVSAPSRDDADKAAATIRAVCRKMGVAVKASDE